MFARTTKQSMYSFGENGAQLAASPPYEFSPIRVLLVHGSFITASAYCIPNKFYHCFHSYQKTVDLKWCKRWLFIRLFWCGTTIRGKPVMTVFRYGKKRLIQHVHTLNIKKETVRKVKLFYFNGAPQRLVNVVFICYISDALWTANQQ